VLAPRFLVFAFLFLQWFISVDGLLLFE